MAFQIILMILWYKLFHEILWHVPIGIMQFQQLLIIIDLVVYGKILLRQQ